MKNLIIFSVARLDKLLNKIKNELGDKIGMIFKVHDLLEVNGLFHSKDYLVISTTHDDPCEECKRIQAQAEKLGIKQFNIRNKNEIFDYVKDEVTNENN